MASDNDSDRHTPNWALLAGLRGVLALAVVCCHIYLIQPDVGKVINGFISPFACVMAFFVISGFSIAHSLEKGNKGYFHRRFYRIYPVFFVAVLISYIPFLVNDVVFLVPGERIEAPEPLVFLLNFIPLQSAFYPTLQSNLPLWSLGVEVLLYALAPLLFVRCPNKMLWSMILVSSLACAGHGLLFSKNYPQSFGLLVPLSVAWAWLLGWMLYKHRDNADVTIAALLIAGATLGLNPQNGGVSGALILGGTIALLHYQNRIRLSEKVAIVANYLGELSYPLYVSHYPAMLIVYGLTHSQNIGLYLVACLLLSVALYHLVDKPMRSRGRKRTPSPAASLFNKPINKPRISCSTL